MVMMVIILIMKIISSSYVKLLMIIIKNTVPIKDIDSILKINKKMCSQVYLEECSFINDSYNEK